MIDPNTAAVLEKMGSFGLIALTVIWQHLRMEKLIETNNKTLAVNNLLFGQLQEQNEEIITLYKKIMERLK